MSNKSKRASKLYKQLTPKQSAILAFNHLAQGNVDELTKVCDAVAQERYISINLEHRGWLEGFNSAALQWGNEFWKNSFNLMLHISLLQTSAVGTLEHTIHTRFIAQRKHQIMAMQSALETFCKQHGLKIETIFKVIDLPEKMNFEVEENDIEFEQFWFQKLNLAFPKK